MTKHNERGEQGCSDCTANRDDYTVTLCPLHAGAPELLEACRRALKTIEELPPRVNEDRYEPLMMLGAAISKATGGSRE